MTDDRPLAFVIMRFGGKYDKVWKLLIDPALDEAGFRPERGDSTDDQVDKVKQIIQKIYEAELVVADLTETRHNVMYELGVAHAMNKRVVMITQNREELPFDLSGYQVYEYSLDFVEVEGFKDYINRVAAKSLRGAVSFGNPVVDALREADVVIGTPARALEAEEAPVGATDEAKGLLEHAADFEQTMEGVTRMYESLGDKTKEYGSKIEGHTANWQDWQSAGQPGGMQRARDIAADFANDMFAYAKSIEQDVEGVEEKAAILETTIPALIDASPVTDENRDEACEEMRSFRSALHEAAQTATETAGSVRQFRESTKAVRGLHSRLDAAIGTVERRIGNVLSFIDRFRSIAEAAITQVDARIASECPGASDATTEE